MLFLVATFLPGIAAGGVVALARPGAVTDELVVDLVDQVLVPFVAPTTPRS